MTKIECINFENKEDLDKALTCALNGEDVYRNYVDKNGVSKSIKIISNHRIYVGNNYSVCVNSSDDGKIYFSVDYFSTDDRIRMSKTQKDQITV